MLIPIGTDVRTHRIPVANICVIALNVLIFLMTDTHLGGYAHRMKDWGTLDAARPQLYQYVTYQFLHGDFLHLGGNMLFLWIFGNAVNARFGSTAYLIFYLAGGVFAGVAYAAVADNPIIGASGAIAAVTTAFLALYPRVHITMLFWLIVAFTFQLPAMFLIVFKIILWDNLLSWYFENRSGIESHVAFSAHLGGYGFGFFVVLLLLITRALPRTQFDVLGLFERWNRRALPVAGGALAGAHWARPIHVEELASRPLEALELSPISRARHDIEELIADGHVAEAARRYVELVELDAQHVLPERQQATVATYLASVRRYADAARAFENLIMAYPAAREIYAMRLMLGLIYRRYLGRPDLAADQLRAALPGLADSRQRALTEDELQLAEAGVSG